MPDMSWYQWLALCSMTLCVGSCLWHLSRLLRLGKPTDLSRPAGSETKGITYSFTKAMNPSKKESAYLHLPTYTAGLIYHLGTFISLFLLILNLLKYSPAGIFRWLICSFLILSVLAGLSILIKRFMVLKIRILSNPDDYVSNFLVTAFQASTVIYLAIGQPAVCPYYLTASALLLYLPVGKLKHLVYFFAARYHLGVFFGRRGVWPQ
jgi:hypothetical protein